MTAAIGELLIRRANKILLPVPEGDGPVADSILAALNVNLQALGCTLHWDALAHLRNLGVHQFAAVFRQLVPILKKLRGVESYKPMYPNFPMQVMEAGDVELYLNALLHYFTALVADVTGDRDVTWLPDFSKTPRPELSPGTEKLTVLLIGAEADLQEISNSLALANTSISETDKNDLRLLISSGFAPKVDRIPNKENLAVVGGMLAGTPAFAHVESMFSTATDVLRLAAAMSAGDVSLAEPARFLSFSRKQRKILLGLIEKTANTAEDMLRWQGRWKRLGERLHPGEHKNIFPRAFAAFQAIRHNEVTSFQGQIEKHILTGNWPGVVSLLKTRPGDFARRLDHILRQYPDASVISGFNSVSERVSTPVLLQVMAHFMNRGASDLRVFFPKGSVAKVTAIPNTLSEISSDIRLDIIAACQTALQRRFAELPSLGKVYLDPKLMNYLVPFSQRSASNSLRTLVRGSRVKLTGDAGTVRFFLWWKDQGSARVDVDLSAMIYNADWTLQSQIAYYNLREASLKAYHSGDITSAPNGACEFIDVDMESVRQTGGRYILMSVNSFTQQPFSEIPDALAGWMLRAEPQSGEIFEPSTVQDRIAVTTPAQAVIPMAIDVMDRSILWMDMAYRPRRIRVNNVNENADSITLVGRAFTESKKPNLYTLLHLHATARGTLVQDPEEADTIFSEEAGTQFQMEEIMSRYLTEAVPSKTSTPAVLLAV